MGCGSILGGLLTAGGAGLGVAGAQQTQSAENSTVQNQINALNSLSKQAGGVFNTALGGFSPQAATGDIASGQQQFTGAANALMPSQPGFNTNQTSTGKAASNARAGLGAQAMGNFAGYSNLPLQWQLQNQQAWPKLGVINQQAAARQAIYPALMQIASRSGNALQGYGSLLGGLGNLVNASDLSWMSGAAADMGANPPTNPAYSAGSAAAD